MSIFNHCDVFGQQRNGNRRKTQNNWLLRRSRSSKVIEVAINRKPVCDFLVINSNWHHISYRFGVIAAYCSNFGHCIFEPPFGGWGTTYDVNLEFIVKRVVDFLLVIIEVFFARSYGWGARSENELKIGDFAPTRLVWPQISKFQNFGRHSPIIFARIVRPMNALQLCPWQFHIKKLCSRLSSSEVRFYRKNGRYTFSSPPPPWGLRGNIG